MRVFNRKKKVWVELPDQENTPAEEREMTVYKRKAANTMAFHDIMPKDYRDQANTRGY